MSLKQSNKATLSRILQNSLANQRAAKDLQGMIGVTGAFVSNAAGTAVSEVVGKGFTVAPHSVTAGAFVITLDVPFSYFLGAEGTIFVPKATAANGDIFELDFSATTEASKTAVVCRVVAKAAPHAVIAPGADAVIMFTIKGIYSDSISNI
jgi:hypothetical protein